MNDTEPSWEWDSRFPEGHPSKLIAEIASTFAEATNDSLVLIDNLAAVDLNHATEEWRLAMVESLRRDLEHVTKLYQNAMTIAREPEDNVFGPLDRALREAGGAS